MTPQELHDKLAAAGCTLTPDRPEPGRLFIEPEPPGELIPAIIANKAGLLQRLRDLARVAELSASIGDAKDDGLANADGSFDVAEADLVLFSMRSNGYTVRVSPADRSKIFISPPSMTPEWVEKVVRLKPVLLQLLEAESRSAEVAALPDPFPGAEMGEPPVGQGAIQLPPDGLAADPGEPLGGTASPPAHVEVGPGGGGGAGQDQIPTSPDGRPADVRPGFSGWMKVPKGRWRHQCDHPNWAGCWDLLIHIAKESEERTIEATVLAAGREP